MYRQRKSLSGLKEQWSIVAAKGFEKYEACLHQKFKFMDFRVLEMLTFWQKERGVLSQT